MEPAPKRRKLGQTGLVAEGDDDELYLEPEELNQQRDPAYQLQKGRALAVNKLKSRFEDIFAKYERDFTGVGDEIDLRTGKVVVDNGHLESMTMTEDWSDEGEDDEDADRDAAEAEKRTSQEEVGAETTGDTPLATVRQNPWQLPASSWPSPVDGSTPRVPSMMYPDQQPIMSPFFSTPPYGTSTPMDLDPTWQVPELPMSSFANHGSHAMGRQKGQNITTKKLAGKLLPVATSTEAEEEDVLSGVSGNVCKTKESPLIKERFPVISSPQEDPNLSELIQEVIQENLPESSPSSRTSITLRPKRRPKRKSEREQEMLAQTVSDPEKKRPRGRSLGPRNASADVTRESSTIDKTVDPAVSQKEAKVLGNNATHTESDDVRPSGVTELQRAAPSKQSLYVVIKATKMNREFLPVQDEEDITSQAHEKAPEIQSSKPPLPAKMERNMVDPSFNFSDDDTLLPKKPRRRRQTERMTAAASTINAEDLTVSKPELDGQPLERNAVDPTFAFSDEENMLSRKSRRKTRLSKPARPLEVDKMTETQAATDTSQSSVVHRTGSRRRTRKSLQADSQESRPSEPVESLETDKTTGSQAAIKPLQTSGADGAKSRSGSKQPVQANSQEPGAGTTELSSTATQADKPAEDQTQSVPEPPEEPPASSAPPSKQQQQQEEPTTPHRPKKSDANKPTRPADTSVISLLSDNEDDEDEISFNLADFTPSGHHRILVHRPFPAGYTNPSIPLPSKPNTTTSNPKKKKKRTSLFPTSSSAQKPKGGTSPMGNTPYSNKGDSSSNKRRKSHQLARSVVKVQNYRRIDRLPSPTGSIIQTPGGTKRRCGEGDFRCERDFCFVCM